MPPCRTKCPTPRAFTLIELLVVTAIIALLISVGTPGCGTGPCTAAVSAVLGRI